MQFRIRYRWRRISICLALILIGTEIECIAQGCGGLLGPPVIAYDAIARRAYLARRAQVTPPALDDRGGYGALALAGVGGANPPTFLCDGKPVEVYIVNRRLKQNFTVTTNTVFQLSNGLPSLRGFPNAPTVAQPTSTPSTPTAPQAKGGLNAAGQMTADQFIAYFLTDETFDKAFQKLQDDGATTVELYTFLRSMFGQYTAHLNGIIGGPPVTTVQGEATLQGTASLFNALIMQAGVTFPLPAAPAGPLPLVGPLGPPTVADQMEVAFDRLTASVDIAVADVQRLNGKVQTYPIVDTLVNLQGQVSSFEDSVRILDHEYTALVVAVQITQDILNTLNRIPYLRERNAAELRTLLRQRYGSTGANLDDATIERIVNLYVQPNGAGDPYIQGVGARTLGTRVNILAAALPQWANAVRAQLGLAPMAPLGAAFPEWATGTPLRTQDSQAAVNALANLRVNIDLLNAAQATCFSVVNRIYNEYRAPVVPLTVDLQGNSGNLIVFYSITGAELFKRYQVISETLQPESGCLLSLTSTASTPGTTPTCASVQNNPPSVAPAQGTATPTPSITGNPQQSGTTTPTTSQAPSFAPADFYGRVEVHHFVRGALVTGISFNSVANISYSWNPCPLPPTGTTSTAGKCYSSTTASSPTTFQFVKNSTTGVAAVVGVNLYVRSQDMFPGARRSWYTRYLPTSPFFGASVFPLNQYFYGGAAEPLRGFNITVGGVYGSQTSLPRSWSFQPGDQVTAPTVPTVPSATRFRNGVFFMLGCDTSLFQAIFGSIWTNVTTIGAPPSVPPSSPSSTTSSGSQ